MADEYTTYTNEKLGASFRLPNRPTVRKQLAFRSAILVSGKTDTIEAYWTGLLQMVDSWKCDHVPDPHALNLETETNPKVADIVHWASNETAGHMSELEKQDPN